jgi:hypothetical protein
MMAITSFASGTQTATVGTEHTLASVNVPGVFVLAVDTSALAALDVLELRIKQIILTGGTVRVLAFVAFYGAQLADDVQKQSIAVPNELTDAGALTFTLKQTFGTGRSYAWKVFKIA